MDILVSGTHNGRAWQAHHVDLNVWRNVSVSWTWTNAPRVINSAHSRSTEPVEREVFAACHAHTDRFAREHQERQDAERAARAAYDANPNHYACGHTAPMRTTSPAGVDCPDCQATARREAAREAAQAALARGPLATRRQVEFLAALAARATMLPEDCPRDREAMARLTRTEASELIDRLQRITSRARRTRCECASGRYGGTCTC